MSNTSISISKYRHVDPASKIQDPRLWGDFCGNLGSVNDPVLKMRHVDVLIPAFKPRIQSKICVGLLGAISDPWVNATNIYTSHLYLYIPVFRPWGDLDTGSKSGILSLIMVLRFRSLFLFLFFFFLNSLLPFYHCQKMLPNCYHSTIALCQLVRFCALLSIYKIANKRVPAILVLGFWSLDIKIPVFRFEGGDLWIHNFPPKSQQSSQQSPESLRLRSACSIEKFRFSSHSFRGQVVKQVLQPFAWTSFNVEYPSFSGIRILDKAFLGNFDSVSVILHGFGMSASCLERSFRLIVVMDLLSVQNRSKTASYTSLKLPFFSGVKILEKAFLGSCESCVCLLCKRNQHVLVCSERLAEKDLLRSSRRETCAKKLHRKTACSGAKRCG